MDSTMGRDIVTISGRTGRSRIKASFIVSAYLLNSRKKPHSAPAGSCVAKRDQWPEKSTTCFSRHYCTENGRFVKGEQRIFQSEADSDSRSFSRFSSLRTRRARTKDARAAAVKRSG